MEKLRGWKPITESLLYCVFQALCWERQGICPKSQRWKEAEHELEFSSFGFMPDTFENPQLIMAHNDGFTVTVQQA